MVFLVFTFKKQFRISQKVSDIELNHSPKNQDVHFFPEHPPLSAVKLFLHSVMSSGLESLYLWVTIIQVAVKCYLRVLPNTVYNSSVCLSGTGQVIKAENMILSVREINPYWVFKKSACSSLWPSSAQIQLERQRFSFYLKDTAATRPTELSIRFYMSWHFPAPVLLFNKVK